MKTYTGILIDHGLRTYGEIQVIVTSLATLQLRKIALAWRFSSVFVKSYNTMYP